MAKHGAARSGLFGRASLSSAASLPMASDVFTVSTTAPVQGRVMRTEIHRYPDQSAALVRINGNNQVIGRLHLFEHELRQVVADLSAFLEGH